MAAGAPRLRSNLMLQTHGRASPMRIIVSSTMEDLKEHRTAAIHVLRQLGHEVLAMEDGPLAKDERFVGLLSTGAILATIGPRVPAISNFRSWLQLRQAIFDEVSQEAHATIEGFHNAFGDSLGNHLNEAKAARTPTSAAETRGNKRDTGLERSLTSWARQTQTRASPAVTSLS